MQAENTYQIGKTGEQLAVELLETKAYKILHLNYRYGRREIDIIAQQDNLLVFVEVKLRKSNLFGYPEQNVTATKQHNIKMVAEHFLLELNWKGNIRFDVIAITKSKKRCEILHIEDAFG